MKILVADESEIAASRVMEILAELPNIEIAGRARSAAECLQFLRMLKPEILILDLEISDGKGLDVLRAIQAEKSDMVSIVMTNSVSLPFREACRKAGAEYFLDKSNEFVRLGPLLARILSKKRTSRLSQDSANNSTLIQKRAG